MQIAIKEKFRLDIYGFSGVATGKQYSETAFQLMGKMWQTVKENSIENKGINIWVYEQDDEVFAGVELLEPPNANVGLERKEITMEKYAYFKHIGPYSLIKQTGQNMGNELSRSGYEITHPYLEIYGHWDKDETKLETELLMCLK